MVRCKSCGAELLFAKTAHGKMAPFDAKPVTITVIVVTPNESGHHTGPQVTGHVSHFATCPHADHWRKDKAASS